MVWKFNFDRTATAAMQRLANCGAGSALAIAGTMVLAAQGAPVMAQEAASSEAEILPSLELTKTQDLDFGDIVAPSNGRVDMTASAAANCTTNNLLVHHGVCQAAAFDGQAQFGQNITVTVPNRRRFTITGPDPRPLRVRRVTLGDVSGLNPQGRTGNVYRYLVTSTDGTFNFHVGARLLIRNNQAPGVYSGTFNVSLDYP